jgi:hypothetical protein
MRPLKDKAAIMPKAKTAAERAKKSRDKRKSFGEKEVRLKLSNDEFEMLEKMCKLRAPCLEPYTPSDYLVTLFRQLLPLDHKQYHLQAKALGVCDGCNAVLPSGCNGTFKGQGDCFYTRDYKTIEL